MGGIPEVILIGRFVYRIAQLTPLDFVGIEGGCPVNVFILEKQKSHYQKTLEKAGHKVDAEINHAETLNAMKLILRLGVVSEQGNKFNVDEFFSRPADDFLHIANRLYTAIIAKSFKCRITKIDRTEAEQIDLIAKRYGIQPIDVLMPNKGYTGLDALCFNKLVASVGKQSDYALIKKGAQATVEI